MHRNTTPKLSADSPAYTEPFSSGGSSPPWVPDRPTTRRRRPHLLIAVLVAVLLATLLRALAESA